MKEKEREILNRINSHYKLDLKESNYQYSHFDAYNKNYIMEIKYRNTYYPDMMIEFSKYTFNREYAKMTNRDFIYVVATEDDLCLFNITSLDNLEYEYYWQWKIMRKQTEFSEREEIHKFIGYINEQVKL